MHDQDGRLFGRLVGFPYDKRSRRFLPSGIYSAGRAVNDIEAFERDVIPSLAGAFIIMTCGTLPHRLYLDPGGSLPIVFSPAERVAGASPSLIMDERTYMARFDHQLHDAAIASEGAGASISGNLTAHVGVHRLLPNHYLDLTDWSAHRHWPRPKDFSSWMPVDDAVTTISTALRDFTTAACQEFDVAITLTAGFDSRLLLASAHDALASCSFVTMTAPGARIDVDMSSELARQFKLLHNVISVTNANAAEQAAWDRTVGDCMLEQNRLTHPTLKLIDADVLLTGMYGEIGRCRLYRQDLAEINQIEISSQFVLSRLTLPRVPKLAASVESWFQELSGLPNSVILDLAFLELRFGSWAMGQHPAQNSLKLHLLPFSQRDVLQSFMSVEPTEEGTERLFRACIEALWPELLQVPINKYGDYRDYLVLLGKLFSPSRARRVLRDRLARRA